ncbi:OpgC family protein [Bartonella bovis]|uniref:Putative transmembrane protein OpgC n=1 Tax=Bartonella bovis 91-4 TaxID=1094491 RepID=N6UJ57_9HYPH|nr:OpgC domain-containing protein [Bartonella bovis]ENN90283.1 putative transmembrane protein OpgC [Bartonella bovis 91-4]
MAHHSISPHDTFLLNCDKHTSPLSHRDTRIDVLRALALLTIFINHIPGTFYEHLTLKNFGFSDSAEIFVLLSGVSLGLSFHAQALTSCFTSYMRKLWKRAFVLYKAHLFTTFITLALFLGASVLWRSEQLSSMNNVGIFLTQPFITFLSTLSLGHQLGYNNILSLYIVCMLFAPFALYLTNKHKGFLLFISLMIYLICGFYSIAPLSYPLQGQWFLNPLSWQFLFIIGLTSAIHLKQGGKIAFRPLIVIFSASYLVFALLWVRLEWWGSFGSSNWSSPLMNFNKTFLSLPRLVHILALASLILFLPCLHERLHLSTRHPLAILGKYSLPVFVTGTIFAMCGQIFKTLTTSTFFFDTLLMISGIAIQFAVAYYYENQRTYRLASSKNKTNL